MGVDKQQRQTQAQIRCLGKEAQVHLDGHAGAMETLGEKNLLAAQAMEGACKLQLQ